MLRYFEFLRKHEACYAKSDTHAEVGLVFPRRAIHAGDASPLEYVESAGRAMIAGHVLFDMLPDDLLPQLKLAKYRAIALAAAEYLEKAERKALADLSSRAVRCCSWMLPRRTGTHRRQWGAPRNWPRTELPGFAATLVATVRTDRPAFLKALEKAAGGARRLSRFNAPLDACSVSSAMPMLPRCAEHDRPLRVEEVMTRDVVAVNPHDTIEEAAAKMKQIDIGPLPVCDRDQVIGMITDRDIVLRSVARAQTPSASVFASS